MTVPKREPEAGEGMRFAPHFRDMRVKAILPHELTVSKAYLQTLDVPLTDIHQVWLADVKMPYTPVVGRDELVRNVWVGRLGTLG